MRTRCALWGLLMWAAVVGGGTAWAGTQLGEGYTIQEITVDGATWTDATTVLTTGQTYDVEVTLRYADDTSSDLAHQPYADSQSGSLDIDGVTVWTGSASTPASTPSTEDGWFRASWTLAGQLLYPGLIGLPGVYTATYAGGALPDGSRYIGYRDVTMKNPVPEPATLALLGSGLFGLVASSRRRRLARG